MQKKMHVVCGDNVFLIQIPASQTINTMDHGIETMIVAVRTKVLKQLVKDSRWSARLSKAKTTQAACRVIEDFCHSHGNGVKTHHRRQPTA